MPQAIANQAASTTGATIVTAQTGAKIRVFSVTLSSDGASVTDVTFLSNTTAISPVLNSPANDIRQIVAAERRWLFETAEGEALKATTGAGSTVGVAVDYEFSGGTSPVDARQGPEIDFSNADRSGYLIAI
jgi:hypothetical protein